MQHCRLVVKYPAYTMACIIPYNTIIMLVSVRSYSITNVT
jgi:hypothetical protein